MSWIDTIAYEKADAKLKALYDRVKGPYNNVDNIMMMHSLRPHTMEGHMAIYKYVLHHRDNTIDKWFLETLGVWVSTLNKCEYCVEHHFAGLKRLLNKEVGFKLDDLNNRTINNREIDLVLKLNKISKIIKDLKKI